MSAIIDKVQKLLAKADDPACTKPEAEAFYAKAQAMMVEHAITEQQIRMATPGVRETPIAKKFEYSSNWLNRPGKKMLLGGIANCNGCQVLFHTRGGKDTGPQYASVVGYEADADFVILLYTSCLLQSASQIKGMSTAQATSFIAGFAVEVFTRLERTVQEATDDGAPGTALVLADRGKEVEQAVDDLFPDATTSAAPKIRDAASYSAGRRAGERADLSAGRRDVGAGRQGGLGS